MYNTTIATYTNKTSIPIKDPYSALTHFIGIIYSALLAPFILARAVYVQADYIAYWSLVVFMVSMVLLYTASTLYHTLYISERVSKVFKKIDHCMISVLIAGTYTPVCLIPLRNDGGPTLLMLVWGLAIMGIVFKLCWVTCPRWISSIIYICMGWLCVFSFPALYRILSHAAFIWLLSGGIIYTVGGVIYALKMKVFNTISPDFGSHEVFHVFVMLGNIAQFICVWLCIR